MEKSQHINIEEVMKYRTRLIENGKRASLENPDKLTLDELQALSAKILKN